MTSQSGIQNTYNILSSLLSYMGIWAQLVESQNSDKNNIKITDHRSL